MSDFDRLVQLSDSLYSRYEAQGHPADLSLCILHYRSALTLSISSTNLSNDTRSKLLGNLANALSMRFQRHGDLADLDHSVECHLTALDFRPPGHPGRANTLSNFATALLVRYGELGMQRDIELAIKHFCTALSMLPPNQRLMPLMNYASALYSRFHCTGDVSDLDDAIRQYRVVLSCSPEENKSTSHYNLANALLSRFKLHEDVEDLEHCVQYSSTALEGMDKAHPDRSLALSCLAAALVKRFELRGDIKDLQNSVENFQTALELWPAEGSQQFMMIYDLADALMIRYELQSDLPDLELAIDHYRGTLNLLPVNHKDEGVFLENLGNALFLRFSRLSNLGDLEEAIQKYFFALEIHSSDSHRRVVTLEALGVCLDARFEQLQNPEDLDTAIDVYNDALMETSQDHPRRAPILKKTAGSLEMRFRLYGGTTDLDRSISYCREALELLPRCHPDQASCCQVIASCLLSRFEEAGDELDLDEAFLYCNTSMSMDGASESLRATCNLLLARILKARVLPWEGMDIQPVFQHLRIAKDLCCTLSHPLIADIYAELASAYYLRFLVEQTKKPYDLHEALGYHELSMNVGGSSGKYTLWPAFRASLQWVRDAETYRHRSGVEAYRSALRLIKVHVSVMTRSPELRQCLSKKYAASLAYDGASFALHHGFAATDSASLSSSSSSSTTTTSSAAAVVEAIEAFEEGRSVLWNEFVRAKSCQDELRLTGNQGAALANTFERLSFQLQLESVSSRSWTLQPGPSAKDAAVRPLLKEKESVVEQIRRIEGFKHFLKFTPFAEFEKVAADGPVVVLNASAEGCDALVLVHTTSSNSTLPTHVPLPYVTLGDVTQMAARFRELVAVGYRGPTTTTTDGRDEDEDGDLERLLSDLWNLVVSPIVQHIMPHCAKGSRLWWCPGGAFASLPLHAAGPYGGRHGHGQPGLSQIYVSSYTPTLQALVRARAASGKRAPARERDEPTTAATLASRARRVSVMPSFLKTKKSRQSLTTTGPWAIDGATATPLPTTVISIVAIGGGGSASSVINSGDNDTEYDETTHALDLLRNRIPPGIPFRRIEGQETTPESVLAAFREPVWLHLACRASLNPAVPSHSGFRTTRTKSGDATVTVPLRDISGAVPRAEFAFLAGRCVDDDVIGNRCAGEYEWCGSAGRAGFTEELERMSMPAALQYSGVRSVVGTLWPVDDVVVRQVADAFYADIIPKAGGSMEYTNAARSLNEALKGLGKGVPLAQKIAFVHVGA